MPNFLRSRVHERTAPRVLVLLLLALFASACSDSAPGSSGWIQAQVSDARDRLMASEGGARMLDVIEAHGGLEAWYAAPTSAYLWEYSNHASNMRFASYLIADNRSRQVYHDLLAFGTPDATEEVEGGFAWDGEEAWISPAERRQPNPRFWSLTGYYFQSIPFVLADPGVRFRVLPGANLDGVEHERIMAYYDAGIGDSPGDVYVSYIDPGTGRVAAVLYTVTFGRAYEPGEDGPPAPAGGTLLHYDDYTTVHGLTTPTRFRGYGWQDGEVGALRNEAWVSQISFREPFDPTRLLMPEDARIEPYSVE